MISIQTYNYIYIYIHTIIYIYTHVITYKFHNNVVRYYSCGHINGKMYSTHQSCSLEERIPEETQSSVIMANWEMRVSINGGTPKMDLFKGMM